MILIILSLLRCVFPSSPYAFYRDIILTNTHASFVGTQALFTFDSASYYDHQRLRFDNCYDLAFTTVNETGTTGSPLTYWLEAGCLRPLTSVWIALDAPLSPHSSRTIRFHYGSTTPSHRSVTHFEGSFFFLRSVPHKQSELDSGLHSILTDEMWVEKGYFWWGTSSSAPRMAAAGFTLGTTTNPSFHDHGSPQSISRPELFTAKTTGHFAPYKSYGDPACAVGYGQHYHGELKTPISVRTGRGHSGPFWNVALYRIRYGAHHDPLTTIPKSTVALFLSDPSSIIPNSWSLIHDSDLITEEDQRSHPLFLRLITEPEHRADEIGRKMNPYSHHYASASNEMIFQEGGVQYCDCDLTNPNVNHYNMNYTYFGVFHEVDRGHQSESTTKAWIQYSDDEYPLSVNVAAAITSETYQNFVPKMVMLSENVPPLGWQDRTGSYSGRCLRVIDPLTRTPGQFAGSSTHSHDEMLTPFPSLDRSSYDGADVLLTQIHCREGSEEHVVEHSHYFSISSSSVKSNVASSIQFRLIERMDYSYIDVSVGSEVGEYWCFEVSSYDASKVCGGGRGHCVDFDVCECEVGSGAYGRDCGETILDAAAFIEEDLIEIPFRFSLKLMKQEEGWDLDDFDCSLVLFEADSRIVHCSWKTVGASAKSLLLRTTESSSSFSDSPIINVWLKPISDDSGTQNVTIAIASYEGVIASTSLDGLAAAGIVVLVLGLIGSIVIVVAVVFAMKKKHKMKADEERIKAIMALDDVDLLIEESEARKQDGGEFVSFQIDKNLFTIDYHSIKLEQRIGSGGSDAVVFRAKWNDLIVAWKAFVWRPGYEKDADSFFSEFEKEVTMLSSLKHPFCLKFFGAAVDPPKIGIAMEYCELGDLQYFLRRRRDYPLSERLRQSAEIASALDYLHTQHVMHRDIKPENVLVANDETTRLMDYGLSRRVQTSTNSLQKMTRRVGTSVFMAPEIAIGDMYSFSADVYSYGILLYEILTFNFKPYGDEMNVELRASMDDAFRPEFSAEHSVDLPAGSVSLTKNCWAGDPAKRPSFADIMESLVVIREGREEEDEGGRVDVVDDSVDGDGGDSTKQDVIAEEIGTEEIIVVEHEDEAISIEEDDFQCLLEGPQDAAGLTDFVDSVTRLLDKIDLLYSLYPRESEEVQEEQEEDDDDY